MTCRIVDTNVWLVASGHSNAGPGCREKCLSWFKNFELSREKLLIDRASFFAHTEQEGRTVLGELKHKLREGSYALDLYNNHFLKHFLIEAIGLEYKDGGAVLPDHVKLPGFEPADRKWVALHLKHPDRPPIHNAFDTDWLKSEKDLLAAGVEVVHLCRPELEEVLKNKGKK